MTIVALGISIEGHGVKEAPRDLNAVVVAAEKTEKAVEKLAPASRRGADGVRRLGEDTRTAAGALERLANQSLTGFNAIAYRAAQQAEYMARQIEKLSMTDLRGFDIEAYGAALDELRAKYDPLFAASKAYERELDELNHAHSVGAIDTRIFSEALARLDGKYDELANGAARAAKAQIEAERATMNHVSSLGHADLALQRFIDHQTGAARASQEWAGPLANLGNELDQLRAKFSPIFAASKQYEASFNEINRAHSLGAISAQEQQAALAQLDAQFEQAARSANALTVANKAVASSFHTTNMLFQLQDIGMMTALGQAPLATMLQQGPQVVGIMHQLGNGRAIMQALGGAIVGLLNPLSLATIATIGLGSAFVQYLMGLNNDLKASSDVIRDQNGLIEQVAQRWGDAVPSLKAYVDELKRAADVSDLNQATDTAIERGYANAAATINDMRVELAAARIDLAALGADSSEIDRLQGAFNTLYSRLLDNTATTDDLENAMAVLAGTTGADTAPSMAGFAGVLQSLVPVLAAAAAEAARLRGERDALLMQGPDPQLFYGNRDFIAEQQRLNSLTTEQLNLEREVARIKNAASSSNQLLSDDQALRLAEESIAADERRRKIMEANRAGAKSGLKERNAYDDLVKGANEFISAQQLEQQALGMTAEAAARMRYEQDLLNKAANDNIKLTPTQKNELMGLAAQMAAVEEATRRVTEIYNFGKDVFTGFFGDLKSGITEGKSLWESLGNAGANALDKIADRALSMAANGIFDMIFGAVMGGIGGGFGTIGVGGVGIPSGGFIPSLTGPKLFAAGGYTGDMATNAAAGIVHGQEFVLNAAATRNIGLPTLNAMNAGYRPAANQNQANDNGTYNFNMTANMQIMPGATEADGAAFARGWQAEMKRWQSSGEGSQFVNGVVNRSGRY